MRNTRISMIQFGILISFLLQYQLSIGQLSYYDDTSGITIKFYSEKEMFPKSWYVGEINAEIEEIDTSEIKRSIACIIKGVRKYPNQVLKDNITEIYMFSSLKFYGVNFGATYYKSKLFIVNSGIKNGYTDLYIEKSLHHEFSSVLYLNFKNQFDETKWKSHSLIGYGTGGVDALKTKTSNQDFDSTLNQKGFLHQYSCSSLENDINAFAENIFLSKNDFWEKTENFIHIKGKLELLIEFYHKINSIFSIEYFKNLH